MQKPVAFLSCAALTVALLGATIHPASAHEEGSFEVVQSMPMPHSGTSGSTTNMEMNGAEPYRGAANATTTGSTGSATTGTSATAPVANPDINGTNNRANSVNG